MDLQLWMRGRTLWLFADDPNFKRKRPALLLRQCRPVNCGLYASLREARAARPSIPVPKRRRVVGSGTGELDGSQVVVM
jgi:hypothetical protein